MSWNYKQGDAEQLLLQVAGLPAEPTTIRWSLDGSRLCLTGRYLANSGFPNGVMVWDTQTGQLVTQMLGSYDSQALNADGRLLAVYDEKKQQQEVIDLASGKILYSLSGIGILGGASFSPDGTYLAYSQGGNAALVNLASGAIQTLSSSVQDTSPFADKVSYLIWSPDSRALVVATGLAANTSGKLFLWQQLPDGAFTEKLAKEDAYASYDAYPLTAAFNSTGSLLAMQVMPSGANLDGKPEVVVYDLQQDKIIEDLPDYRLEPWVDAQTLLIREAEYDTRLARLNTADGQLIFGTSVTYGGMELFAPDGLFYGVLNADEGTSVEIYPWNSGKKVAQALHGSSLAYFSWSPDGHWLATLGIDGTVRVWPVMITN